MRKYHFRRIADPASRKLSPELRSAIRRAQSQREAALELRELADEPVQPAPTIDPSPADPEAFGAAARKLLGVGVATQLDWTDPGRALAGWTTALEDRDVMVLQAQRIDTSEMRGFSVSAPTLPVIVLNGGDSTRGRIFTLLHEYTHLLRHTAGVCDLHEQREASPSDDLEVFCNQVAAAILLPADIFRADPRVEAAPANGQWSDGTLRALSDRYGVSREVVLRRLYSFRLTTWDFMREKTAEFQRGYEEQRQRQKERQGSPPWHRMRVRDYGRPYVRLALDAYYRDDITASALSEYLEVKLNKLANLEEELSLVEARA